MASHPCCIHKRGKDQTARPTLYVAKIGDEINRPMFLHHHIVAPARMSTCTTRGFVLRWTERETKPQSPPRLWTTIRWSTTRDIESFAVATLIVFFRPVRHHAPGEAARMHPRFCVFTFTCCRYKANDVNLHSTAHCRMMRFDHTHRHGLWRPTATDRGRDSKPRRRPLSGVNFHTALHPSATFKYYIRWRHTHWSILCPPSSQHRHQTTELELHRVEPFYFVRRKLYAFQLKQTIVEDWYLPSSRLFQGFFGTAFEKRLYHPGMAPELRNITVVHGV